jgi:hypothetical protein
MKTFSKYIISKLIECRDHTKNFDETINPIITRQGCHIIAIGDIHGDIQLMIDTLTISGVIKKTNAENNNAIQINRSVQKYNKKGNPKYYEWIEYYEWIAKNTIVVQVGDQIDRCRPTDKKFSNCKEQHVTYDDEASDIEILLFFTNLHIKASAIEDGSAVYSLLGNHELMNIIGDIRYVSYKNLEQLYVNDENKNLEQLYVNDENKDQDQDINKEVIDVTNEDYTNNIPNYIKRRKNIFRREGILAKFIACTRYSILIVNGYLFVHGGVLGSYINQTYNLQDLNNKIKDFIMNKKDKKTEKEITNFIFNADSPFYTRKLGNIKKNTSLDDCTDVQNIINSLHLKGIIVGHTPHLDGINGTCKENDKNKLFRIDVASSKAFKYILNNEQAKAQVLKISNDDETYVLKYDSSSNIISENI